MSPVRLLQITDGRGDAGPDSQPYCDAVDVTLDERGGSIVVTVIVAGSVTERLPDGEVMGVGVDFFRSDEGESDYQLFADGGGEGWFAYLQTPSGFIDYPGSFGVGGTRFVFEVPWSALGGRLGGRVSAFIDWSRPGNLRNLVAADAVPDSGNSDFRI